MTVVKKKRQMPMFDTDSCLKWPFRHADENHIYISLIVTTYNKTE